MAKKRRETREINWFSRSETAHTIIAIVSAVLAIFLLLSSFGLGGEAGRITQGLFKYLFGAGLFVLPIVLILLSISFISKKEREVSLPQIIGALFLFLSILGITELVFRTQGGLIGGLAAKPLLALFDLYVSLIVLAGITLISIIVIFDTAIKIDFLNLLRTGFRKKDAGALARIESDAIEKAVDKLVAVPDEAPLPQQKKSDPDSFAPIISRGKGKDWVPPPLSLLEKDRGKPGVGDIKANANLIKRTLLNFGIIVEMDEISIGPSVTRYALKPAEGVKLSKILGLQNNLELALAAHPVRIEAPIPGKSLVGIEVPNTQKSTVGLGSLVGDEEFVNSDKPLLFSLGRDIAGQSHFANLSKMPHLLIAGATGSGKSVSIHTIITSFLYKNPPEHLKFIMIDPKRVELTLYNGIPHLLTPVITEPKKAIIALKWVAKEMERRYDILEKSSARDINSYHQNAGKDSEPMPYIVVVVDELADLMQSYPRELEAAIVRLAQMSRAVGIHLILSTQRPSVNVITGLIKANIPARIALQVASQIDSRTILDMAGAEKLLGAGDMLYLSSDMSKPTRIQSAFISEHEVKEISKYLREAYADELESQINLSGEAASPNAIFSANLETDPASGDDDELYEEARVTVMEAGKASTSFLQRKLRVGYARAARLMDLLEERGIIGPGFGAKPREVIAEGAAAPIPEESYDETRA